MHKLYCIFVKLRTAPEPELDHTGVEFEMESLVLAATLVLLSLLTPSASQEANTTLPLTYRARAAEGGEQVCSPDELRQRLQAITRSDVSNLLRNNLPALVPCSDRNLGQLEHCPAASCSDIVAQSQVLHPSGYYWIISSNGTTVRLYCDMDAVLYIYNLDRGTTQTNPADSCSDVTYTCPSGYYWVRSSNGTAVQVYCDMDRVCGCNSTGGWTRVAYLNMTDPSQQCPSAWTLQTRSSEPRRLCGRSSSGAGCKSVTYSTFGINYSHVCGRVTGYQSRTPDAFHHDGHEERSLESYYVDGVSLTHGPTGARQHIWTFAAGNVENGPSSHPEWTCPCADRATPLSLVPSFIGNDYFCESGNSASTYSNSQFYPNDPLWDGQGCGSSSCCELSYPPGVTPPWFCKQLPQATTNDIEVRICGDQDTGNEDTPVELIEIYIN